MLIYAFLEHYPSPYKPYFDSQFEQFLRDGHELRNFAFEISPGPIPDKVRALGADHVILYRSQDVAAEVRALTGGKGVPVAYDSVGRSTFDGTLASLARRGWFVSFGNASGPAPHVDPLKLSRGGSLVFTRPTLFDYIATTEELDASAAALFGMIASGKVQIEIVSAR